jgi:type I restriction enzyme S subunit
MLPEWPSATVAELQSNGVLLVEDGNHGENRPRPSEFSTFGIPFIRAADMANGRVLFDSASRINQVARNRVRKGIGQDGDVILSHKGTVGKVAFVEFGSEPFICSPQTTFWRVLDDEVIHRKYLLAYMRSHGFAAQLLAVAGETDMAPYVSLTNQRGLRIVLPPIEAQRTIAHILGTLDDKIELNRQMNQTLDEIARTLFKSWFVDFDPVRAKMEGRQPEGMDAETAALFPDRLVDSALGPIPEGWEVKPIGDLVRVVGGSTPSTANPVFWESGTNLWVTPKDLSGMTSPILIDATRRITDEGVNQISSRLLPTGSVLLSSRAPVGYLAITTEPTAINQGFIGMICDQELPNYYVLNWARENMGTIKGNAGGTTFAEISKTAFRPIHAIAPCREILSAYSGTVTNLYALIENNLKESRTLTELRDMLLPELLSGRLISTQAEAVSA